MTSVRNEHGFVLSLVIFAVAALSIAGTALFLVVQSENAMAESGGASSRVFQLADAGLARYMGASVGTPRPEVVYEMGGGTVTVRAERVMAMGDSAEIYLLRSDAVIPDRRIRNLVARRTVQQFAFLRTRPFRPIASIVIAGSDVHTNAVVFDGRDQCGVAPDVAGIATMAADNLQGTFDGSPPIHTAGYDALMTTPGLDWATLTDPAYEFDYELPDETWPRFGITVAADEYPTIRVDGNFSATSVQSGRGLLVVTGDISFGDGFVWDGVIMAGGMPRTTNATAVINGVVLTGFAGVDTRVDLRHGNIRYDSCKVAAAFRGFALLSPVPGTWWEASE
jgi:hypothetical protein